MRRLHLSDQELVRILDGEMDPAIEVSARGHLEQCGECRERLGALRAASDMIGHSLRRRVAEGADGPAAKLRAALRQVENTEPVPWWRPYRYAVPTAATALLIAAFVYWAAARPSANPALPNASLTPGATRMMTRQQVCEANVRDDEHVIPAHLAGAVFHAYGVHPRPGDYEVDYLINPALGGADDARNLWPQPYREGVWTARVKDALEEHLRELVCGGDLDLATAQRDIAVDWIAAYRKYFQTATPLPAHALFVKDKPWR